ncbi:predicted protein [Postia placenta Mad-698-R]|nr:predicted protein [Postia placenta Mad-698-R]
MQSAELASAVVSARRPQYYGPIRVSLVALRRRHPNLNLADAYYLCAIVEEVRCFWQRKLSAASLVFFLNRYTLLVASSSMVIAHLTWKADTSTTCKGLGWVYESANILLFVESAVFSALRAYAIGGRIVMPALVVLVLSLTAGGAMLNSERDFSADIIAVMTATRAIAIAADLIVFAVTIHHTFGIKRQARQLGIKVPLVTMLLVDGFLYFVVGVQPTISSILISRFMFHLHRSPSPAGSTLRETHSLMTCSVGSAPLDSQAFAHFRTNNIGVGTPSAGMTSSAGIALEDDWGDAASDVESVYELDDERLSTWLSTIANTSRCFNNAIATGSFTVGI